MSGQYKGVQSIIKNTQPLADYIHCTAHASNLAAQSVARSSLLASTALDVVNELGNLVSRSGKFKSILKDIAISSDSDFNIIRPLCPTRWLARVAPVRALLAQYEIVLDSLDQMKNDNPTAQE